MGTFKDSRVCTLLLELHGDWIFSNIMETEVVEYYLKSVSDVSQVSHLHHGHLQALQDVHPFT